MATTTTAVGGFARQRCNCCDEGIDAMLDPCCAKELSDRRKARALLRQLRAADPTRKAWAARRGVLGTPVVVPPAPVEESRPSVDEESSEDSEPTLTPSVDDEDSFEDSEDEEAMERLREARVAQLGRRRPVPDVSRLEDGVVVAHAYDPDRDACAWIDLALEKLAADRRDIRVCRSRRGDAFATSAWESDRVPPERLAVGALLVFEDGTLKAMADVATFADDDTLAEDVLHDWLDRAGAFPAPLEPGHDEPLEPDDDDDKLADSPPYPCGKPGCAKPFEHHHIGLEIPFGWGADDLHGL